MVFNKIEVIILPCIELCLVYPIQIEKLLIKSDETTVYVLSIYFSHFVYIIRIFFHFLK